MSELSKFILINGQKIPPPKRGVKPTIVTIVSDGRNANGAVVGQRVGRDQYKIDDLEWPYLSASEWENILNVLKNLVVDVTFTDPSTNRLKTIEMYCGNRTGEPYWLDSNGKPTYYVNCKVNLIDMGRPIKNNPPV